MDSASITFNPRLRELLDSGNLDWDNEYHREAYLKAWVSRPLKQEEEETLDGRL